MQNEDSKKLQAILQSGEQPGANGDRGQSSNLPTAQQTMPLPAAARNRAQGFDDSENVNPGSEILSSIMKSGAQPQALGGSPQGEGKSVARSVGEFTGKMSLAATAAATVNSAFTGLTNRTLRLNESLAEYNSVIATSVGEARARQIQRQIRQGSVIGDSYRRLDESQQDYRDLVTQMSAPFQAAGMEFTAAINNFRNSMLEHFAPSIESFGETVLAFIDWWNGTNSKTNVSSAPAAQKFLSDAADGKLDGFGTPYMNPGNRPLTTAADRARIFGSP
ncbi:MAG: hypothetical protein ACO23H_03235 [Alphaproteobacteria bacterium]